jgi:hypothetical protein
MDTVRSFSRKALHPRRDGDNDVKVLRIACYLLGYPVTGAELRPCQDHISPDFLSAEYGVRPRVLILVNTQIRDKKELSSVKNKIEYKYVQVYTYDMRCKTKKIHCTYRALVKVELHVITI